MTPDTTWATRAASTTRPAALPASGALRALYAGAFGLVLLVGALSLATPFWGDQALFAVYGRQLSDGAVLYRDLFDLKQPGIFVFYAAGGLLFGFTEVGIHLFELLYWLAFLIFAVLALRRYITTRWALPFIPVFTVVVYYLYVRTVDLTQIEAVVAVPLLVAWWLLDGADPALRRAAGRYAAAGVAAAAVVVLKHLYVLIVLAFLGYVVVRSWRQGTPFAAIVRSIGAFALGLLAPLLLVTGYFAVHGQLERIWWAYVEYPGAARALDPAPIGNLTGGARRFTVGHAPFLILAVLGVADALRRRARPRIDLVIGMVLWLLVGLALVLIQFRGEWHWLLFTVPTGILAALGLEASVGLVGRVSKPVLVASVAVGALIAMTSLMVGGSRIEMQKWLLLLVVAGMCLAAAVAMLRAQRLLPSLLITALVASFGLALIDPVNKLRSLAEHRFAVTAEARVELQRSWNQAYWAADEDLAHLQRDDVLPGPLYVFGDPVLLLRAGRPQAAAMHGWGPEKLVPRAWEELHGELRSSPPPYIVVNGLAEAIIEDRYPALMDLVEAGYEPLFEGASGTWYVRRDFDA